MMRDSSPTNNTRRLLPRPPMGEEARLCVRPCKKPSGGITRVVFRVLHHIYKEGKKGVGSRAFFSGWRPFLASV